MQITARLNHLRIAPRKVRQAARVIEGLTVSQAEEQLQFLAKHSAQALRKLLRSAVSNAENNYRLPKDNLRVRQVLVDEGTKLKRFRPKAMGQVGPVQKRTSRLKIVLEEKAAGLRLKPVKPASRSVPEPGPEEAKKVRTVAKSPTKFNLTDRPQKKIQKSGVFSGIKDISRKLFRRKSV